MCRRKESNCQKRGLVLGNHLDEMVRDRVWLVVIAVVMIAVVVSIIVNGAFGEGDVKIVEVSFRQEMEGNVIDVEDEEQHRQRTQPPGRRRRLSAGSAPTAV